MHLEATATSITARRENEQENDAGVQIHEELFLDEDLPEEEEEEDEGSKGEEDAGEEEEEEEGQPGEANGTSETS